MGVSSFSFDQPKLVLKTDFSGSEKLVDHTERKEDGYRRGTLTPSATKRDCGTRSEQPCALVYGGSPGTNEMHSFELFGNFKKTAITAQGKQTSQASKFAFYIDSRYSSDRTVLKTQDIRQGQISSSISISKSKTIGYKGGTADETLLIGSSINPLTTQPRTKNLDLDFGPGNNHLKLDAFQGSNKSLGKITAKFGDGDDLIDLSSGAHDPLFAEKLKIKTGYGDDKINRYKKGGLMAAKKMHFDLGPGADGMSIGIAEKVASKVKSIVVDFGKDQDNDHVDIYAPKGFNESLISFKNFRDEDFYQIWHW